MSHRQEAYAFERTNALHDTRNTKGLINRVIPSRWSIHHDQKTQQKSVATAGPLVKEFSHPVVLSVGAGGGSLFKAVWKEPGITRVGLDINHDVLARDGRSHFKAVEGDAGRLPFADESIDIVLFDYVLHHLVGQDVMENAIREGSRVLRRGGYMIAREPSSYSPSGLALNFANKFRLMHTLAGASNYEFAIAPPYLLKLFKNEGSIVSVEGLSYFWSRRLPIWVQEAVSALEPHLFKSERARWFADFMLYVVRKHKAASVRPTLSRNERRDHSLR